MTVLIWRSVSGSDITCNDKQGSIGKGGWDKMPGQEKSDYFVSQACADGLGLLVEK